MCIDRRRHNGFKLKGGRFRLVVRNMIFTVRVVQCRNSLSAETVDGLSLEVFKACLDGA